MNYSSDAVTGQAIDLQTTDRGAIRPAVFAAFLGLAVLYVVGFAQPGLLHNAAHDSRHTVAFPCH